MRELTHDPFYELIDKQYDRCVIDYCLIAPDMPYRGIRSHREAVLFAILKMIERYLVEQRTSEERWTEKVKDDFFPWSLDFGKAQAHRIDPEEFLFVPTVVRKIKGGSVIYDRTDPDIDAGEQIPYWYAFLEPPQWSDHTPDDFRHVNGVLFPEGADALEVFEWTTDWSNYFDAGHEWWGTACWSIYDKCLDRFVVLLASATD
ncbi:MAG: hypothetical protein IJI68_12655 [Eggerthellaceae bacterium]|nr:hypothetical protein [Eggerthellaceae bacterium]